jgi:4-hydroxy-tetrahydrodipicolinate reductase
MERIAVMINGLPGKVSTTIATGLMNDGRFRLLPWSLTGPEIAQPETTVGPLTVKLVRPDVRDERIGKIKKDYPGFITVDYTHPASINDNCDFYCRHGLPFVMGTTGGDRERLMEAVKNSDICAVIAPNMAKQIVGFQAMMEYAAREFPGMFAGYSLTIRESHQQGKADTSGTAKAMVRYFNALGVDFSESDIIKERDPEKQAGQWKIPAEHLDGHAWHTYTLLSPDKTVKFEFTHNINGREVYADGTAAAVAFLDGEYRRGKKGHVFSMIDVLKGSRS